MIDVFAGAGLLDPAAVWTARRFAQLYRESDSTVILAVALAVRALEQGSVCFNPATVHQSPAELAADVVLPWPEPISWTAAISASAMTTVGDKPSDRPRPLRMIGQQVYLEKYWLAEESARTQLTHRFTADPPRVDEAILNESLSEAFGPPGGEADEARQAAQWAAGNWLTVIAGGPGTGKTTTIRRLTEVLRAVLGPTARIALAAPTGKAAARLSAATGAPASTLHKLLGIGIARPQPTFHAQNPLPYDVIVVDEMSMVSLTTMNQLIAATRPPAQSTGTRLVLVGDPDQLASVEAGAVLADITHSPAPVMRLTRTWRYGGRLQEVATALRAGEADQVVTLLTTPVSDPRGDNAHLVEVDPADPVGQFDGLRAEVVTAQTAVTAAAERGDAVAALAALNQHRLLCAHRVGTFGLAHWNREIENWLPTASRAEWYLGRPVLITRNDRDLGLTNGDSGVLVRTSEGPKVAFERADGDIQYCSPALLDHLETLHAMTVHKAQGSQFASVAVILPPLGSPLLTRELLYTALTRASAKVVVYGSVDALIEAVNRPANRASGLRRRLLSEKTQGN